MKLSDVVRILDAQVVCGEERLDMEVNAAFGADLMSDVLAFVDEHTLLLTGMINSHVMHTAEMLDVHCIVFVRGKQAPTEIIQQANELEITLLSTDKTLFTSCGLLYAAGLRSCARKPGAAL